MSATTFYEGASAILFGFEGLDQNGDPIQSGDAVALAKSLQAAGFKVDDELPDSYLVTVERWRRWAAPCLGPTVRECGFGL